MLFANTFVTNSICTPSRAAILTGTYSHKNGVPVFNRFDGSQPTVAKLLQAAGYHTGMIGKWHLGSDPTGFDRWEILPGQGVYHDPVLYTATGEKTYAGRYVTDVITDLAIDFIRERPKDRPFFLMCHHKAPHREWTPDEKHRRMFEGRAIPEPPTLRDDYATRTDALRENQQRVADDLTRRDLKLEPPPGLDGPGPRGVALREADRGRRSIRGREDDDPHRRGPRPLEVPALHAGLPRLRAVGGRQRGPPPRLPEARAASSGTRSSSTRRDQGFFLGDHGLYDKRFMYEESLRMPLLVRWPAVVRGRARGRRRWPSTSTSRPPSWRPPAWRCPPRCRAGASCRCSAARRPRTGAPRSTTATTTTPAHHDTRAHYGVRTATHKLIYFWKKDQWELFDLRTDPRELRNLYGQPGQEAVTAELKATLARLRAELQDDDRFADEQPPAGVDGKVAALRGK